MIPTSYYGLGFLIYILIIMFTFKVYSKEKEIFKIFPLILIYLFYTGLSGYVINFTDLKGNIYEKIVEIFIYALVGAIFLFNHYETKIKENKNEELDEINKNNYD